MSHHTAYRIGQARRRHPIASIMLGASAIASAVFAMSMIPEIRRYWRMRRM